MSEAAIVTRVQQLVAHLEPLLLDLDKVSSPSQPSLAYPPATDANIDKAERRLDFVFPPSYRALLKMHNGWKNYHFTWRLFGVGGPGYTEPAQRLEKDLEVFEKLYRRSGADFAENLKRDEKTDPKCIYLPHHLPLAANFDTGYMVFDRNRPAKNGEYEIAWVVRGSYVENRYGDVSELLENAIRAAEHEIDSYGGDAGAGPAAPKTPAKKASARTKAKSASTRGTSARKAAKPTKRRTKKKTTGKVRAKSSAKRTGKKNGTDRITKKARRKKKI